MHLFSSGSIAGSVRSSNQGVHPVPELSPMTVKLQLFQEEDWGIPSISYAVDWRLTDIIPSNRNKGCFLLSKICFHEIQYKYAV